MARDSRTSNGIAADPRFAFVLCQLVEPFRYVCPPEKQVSTDLQSNPVTDRKVTGVALPTGHCGNAGERKVGVSSFRGRAVRTSVP